MSRIQTILARLIPAAQRFRQTALRFSARLRPSQQNHPPLSLKESTSDGCLRDGPTPIDQSVYAEATFTAGHIFIFLMVGVLLCYSSVLVIPYAFSDDYLFLIAHAGLPGTGNTSATYAFIANGRPTGALLTDLFFSYANTIGDLRYLRLWGVIGIGLLAWSIDRALVRVGWSRKQTVLLSVIICTLPSFQVYASCATALFYPFAALASGRALAMAERACDEQCRLYKWSLVAGAVLLLLVAFTIYQPAAMFFWVFAAIGLLTRDASLPFLRRRVLWHSAVAFAGLSLGFGVYQLGLAYGRNIFPPRSELAHDILGKVLWFLRWPLVDALSLAKLSGSPALALSVAIFIAGGLLLYFGDEAKKCLLKFLLALAFIPLSYLPNLVIAENWSAYRTQSALTSVIVVYAFLALQGYERTLLRPTTASPLTAGLGFAALVSALLAAYNVSTYFAFPQILELRFMRSHWAQQDLSQVRSFYIIPSTWQNFCAPAVYYDEFGFPSSAHPLSPGPMVYLLLRETKQERLGLPIEAVPAAGPINPPPGALVIDMRKLANFR